MRRHNIPSFSALRAFEATFRLGGVRKAAADLSVSHAIVSRHVANLEDWVGVALVSRTGSRLELTELGSRYHAKISAAFAELAFATEELQHENEQRNLRIHCTAGLAVKWLARRIVEFENRNSGYVVELKPTNQPANLHAHEADVNIMFLRDNPAHGVGDKWIKVKELARPKLIIVASPRLASSLPNITRAADLLDLPLLHPTHQLEWRAWLEANCVEVTKRLRGINCWEVGMAIEAAKMGRGLLLIMPFMVEQELRQGDLVELAVPRSSPIAIGTYVFAAREDRWSSPRIAALRRFICEQMQEA